MWFVGWTCTWTRHCFLLTMLTRRIATDTEALALSGRFKKHGSDLLCIVGIVGLLTIVKAVHYRYLHRSASFSSGVIWLNSVLSFSTWCLYLSRWHYLFEVEFVLSLLFFFFFFRKIATIKNTICVFLTCCT